MALEKELATYERLLPTLLDQEGKFVLIHDETLDGVYDTYEDALKVGYQTLGVDRPFLVRQIQAVQLIQSVTRNLIFPCRT
jgi:aromatic ring-cleaving dioxygenase